MTELERIDRELSAELDILRHSAHVEANIIQLLEQMRKDLIQKLAYADLTNWSKARLNRLLSESEALIASYYTQVQTTLAPTYDVVAKVAASQALPTDYGIEHRPPMRGSGAPLYDLTGGGTVYPDDVYSTKAVQYYGTGDTELDRATFRVINSNRNEPDAPVVIYRAVSKDVPVDAKINPGDWVTINLNYAKMHGESTLGGNYRIIKQQVKAKDIFTNGDSIHEFGYDPVLTPLAGKALLTPRKIRELIDNNSPGEALDFDKLRTAVGQNNYVLTKYNISKLLDEDLAVDSSKAVGSKGPIVIGEDGRIIDGRHRAAAAKKAGKQQIDAYIPFADVTAQTAATTTAPVLAAATMPSRTALESIVGNVMIDGAATKTWWSRIAADTAFKFKAAIRQGLMQGETQAQIFKRVNTIVGLAGRNSVALVHTSIMQTMNDATEATLQKNADVTPTMRHLATLDSSTCVVCGSRDGLEWNTLTKEPVGHNLPYITPPLHFGCRCKLVGVTKLSRLVEGQRASMFGPVDRKVTFNDFLGRQSPKFQNEVLGKGRAEMYRSGKLTLRDLVSGTGAPLSLGELASKYT